jgi:hypothetical protein
MVATYQTTGASSGAAVGNQWNAMGGGFYGITGNHSFVFRFSFTAA